MDVMTINIYNIINNKIITRDGYNIIITRDGYNIIITRDGYN